MDGGCNNITTFFFVFFLNPSPSHRTRHMRGHFGIVFHAQSNGEVTVQNNWHGRRRSWNLGINAQNKALDLQLGSTFPFSSCARAFGNISLDFLGCTHPTWGVQNSKMSLHQIKKLKIWSWYENYFLPRETQDPIHFRYNVRSIALIQQCHLSDKMVIHMCRDFDHWNVPDTPKKIWDPYSLGLFKSELTQIFKGTALFSSQSSIGSLQRKY